MATVIRYVPTYVNKDGMRTLVLGAQGRWTWETPEGAQAWLDAMLEGGHLNEKGEPVRNNSPKSIRQLYGDNPQFEVRPCECWAGHFDPVGVWFD